MNSQQFRIVTSEISRLIPEPLPDICRNQHHGNPESEAANASVQPSKARMQARILELLAEQPRTCDELEVLTGWSHQSCSARCAELLQAHRVMRNGKRPTRSGRMAAVLEVVCP